MTEKEKAVLEEERKRCLEIVGVALRRIAANRGRGWREELEGALKEMEAGHARLFEIG